MRHRKKEKYGFTLIELLVVIGILGILAAALVATIDPFEQLKKGTDSKIKNIVVEFENANIRYFTTHSTFPWTDTSSPCYDAGIAGSGFSASQLYTDLQGCLGSAGTTNTLIGEGELKESFVSNTNDLDKVLVTWDPSNANSLIVCFAPTSKSQKASPETIYNNDGSDNSKPTGDCPDATVADNTCFWCTK